MIFGFTGPRTGMNDLQRLGLADVLDCNESGVLHHGACVGADETAHHVAIDLDYRIVIHPPLDTRLMMDLDPWLALNDPRVLILPPKRYLARDLDIVKAATNGLIATPDGPHRAGSGTWHTIGFAAARNTPRIFIWPNGNVEKIDK